MTPPSVAFPRVCEASVERDDILRPEDRLLRADFVFVPPCPFGTRSSASTEQVGRGKTPGSGMRGPPEATSSPFRFETERRRSSGGSGTPSSSTVGPTAPCNSPTRFRVFLFALGLLSPLGRGLITNFSLSGGSGSSP